MLYIYCRVTAENTHGIIYTECSIKNVLVAKRHIYLSIIILAKLKKGLIKTLGCQVFYILIHKYKNWLYVDGYDLMS